MKKLLILPLIMCMMGCKEQGTINECIVHDTLTIHHYTPDVIVGTVWVDPNIWMGKIGDKRSYCLINGKVCRQIDFNGKVDTLGVMDTSEIEVIKDLLIYR